MNTPNLPIIHHAGNAESAAQCPVCLTKTTKYWTDDHGHTLWFACSRKCAAKRIASLRRSPEQTVATPPMDHALSVLVKSEEELGRFVTRNELSNGLRYLREDDNFRDDSYYARECIARYLGDFLYRNNIPLIQAILRKLDREGLDTHVANHTVYTSPLR